MRNFFKKKCFEKESDSAEGRCNSSCSHAREHEKEIDELLQNIWELREDGKVTKVHYEESSVGKIVLANLKKLQNLNLVKIVEGHIHLTEAGEVRAKNIVRRHRLTERMLTDLFDIPGSGIEGTSCEFEHILNDEVTDSICAFLGHPATCPHGKPIPKGEGCCDKLTSVIRPLVVPLTDLMPGENGRITFISSKDKLRLQRLSSLGVMTGRSITVQQKLPECVIKVDETEIAIDGSLASEIYVKRVG